MGSLRNAAPGREITLPRERQFLGVAIAESLQRRREGDVHIWPVSLSDDPTRYVTVYGHQLFWSHVYVPLHLRPSEYLGYEVPEWGVQSHRDDVRIEVVARQVQLHPLIPAQALEYFGASCRLLPLQDCGPSYPVISSTAFHPLYPW